MNASLPLCMAQALAPFAPPSSVVHQIVSEEQAQRIDAAMLHDKQTNRAEATLAAQALRLQIQRQGVMRGAL